MPWRKIMEPWGIVILVILIVLFFYLISSFIFTYQLNRMIFGVRGKDPSHPIYVHFEDYPDLARVPYETTFRENKIRGYIYSDRNIKEYKGFLILSHGLFGSHLQYLVDVNYLTKAGYQVLCYDQYGVGESEGENQVSLSHGILVLNQVIEDVEKRNVNHSLPLGLYGHSWGAYCSMGVLKDHDEIKIAVLRSGPVKPAYAGLSILHLKNKPLYWYLKPILPFCLAILSSHKATVNCMKNRQRNRKTKILVIYAKNDPMVDFGNSQYRYFTRHKDDNVTLCLTEDGLHNSIITEESYSRFVSLTREYKQKMKDVPSEEKEKRTKEFMSGISRANMVTYKEDVKEKILNFMEENF